MINIIRYITLACIFIIINPVDIYGQFQPTPVEKSTQKILFQGNVYYIHKVKKGQTAYSISKAYGVSIQEMKTANPKIKLELINPGQTLKIPEILNQKTNSETATEIPEDQFYYHIVKPKQTISYLSRKYNVSKEIIYRYNPESRKVLSVGQTIKIPNSGYDDMQLAQDFTDSVETVYIVKTGDTLYSIAKKYYVNVADFIYVNPVLRWGLKPGMVLNIPGRSGIMPYDSTLTDSLTPKIQLFTSQQCDSIKNNYHGKALKIALLFPFCATETLRSDSILTDSVGKIHTSKRKRAIGRSFTEFYEGFLLALDSLKNTGQKITLFTFDTELDTLKTDEILEKLEAIKPDFIIGPFNNSNIKKISSFSEVHRIPLILPLSKTNKSITGENPYIINLMPDFKTEIYLASGYLSGYCDKNIILLHNQDTSRMDNLTFFRESLFNHFPSSSLLDSIHYNEIRINEFLEDSLKIYLRDDIKNLILFISNDEALVSNVIGLLTIQDEKHDIQVFGLPSWRKFKNLRVDQIHELNTILYTPYFIDYSMPSTTKFIELCRNKLGYEPFRTISNGSGFNFAFLGYETGLIFSQSHLKFGPDFIHCLCNINISMPQLEYTFKSNGIDGFKINSIRLINYSREYELKRIDHVFSGEKNIFKEKPVFRR